MMKNVCPMSVSFQFCNQNLTTFLEIELDMHVIIMKWKLSYIFQWTYLLKKVDLSLWKHFCMIYVINCAKKL